MKDYDKIDFVTEKIDLAFLESERKNKKYWLLISNYYNDRYYKIYYSNNKEYLKRKSKQFKNLGFDRHTNI